MSGLKEVRYEVFSQGVATAAPVVLHSFILDAPTLDQIEANQSFETVVRVPAAQNNSNQVVVVATATDRAGNVTVASTEFKIDITPPAISVSYSNNDVRNGQYFKAPRVATISVRERNFDPKGAKISTNGSVGGWTNVGGEGDDTLWTCQISFASDNDYTLDVSVTDLAGNVSGAVDYGGRAASTKFTVDLTKPVIAVAYNTKDVRNENYYKAARTATSSITEHNCSAEDVLVTTTDANGDIGGAAPRPGGGGRSGDVNTTAVAFNHDALYTITISATDLAGNEAEIYPLETFTVDTTLPIVEITGVEDNHAYNSPEGIPVVTFQDTNFSADGVTISLTGSVRREVEPKGRLANTSSGGVFNFENFPDEPEYDDVYTLHAQITDLAGNEAEAELMFSLNRYGSTYLFDEPTAALIQQMYTNQSPELNVTEVNVNTLSYQEVTYGRSGDMVTLNEGDDYKLGKEGSETTWKEYNYTVFDSNFEQDGVYNVTLYSEDEATNTTSNRTTRLQENVKPLDFTLDTTSPTVVVTGVADSTRYNEATRILRVTCEDNMALAGLELFLQDGTTPVASFTAEELVNGGGTV